MLENHKAGFVSIVGKPNVGKSTLLNALLETKLSIVSPKAQTTRRKILGILNAENYQIVFLDTPGYMTPKYELHKIMIKYIEEAVQDADVVVFVTVPKEKFSEEEIIEALNSSGKPVILLVNKMDLFSQAEIQEKIEAMKKRLKNLKDVLVISALTKHNIEAVKEIIAEHLPQSPPFYPKDQLSDLPERLFVAEIIREKIFLLLKQEIPYSCLVEVVFFKELPEGIHIEANIYTETKSQKPIVIGKKGTMIRKIKQEALKDLKEFLGKEVFLKLHVKVMEKWTNNSQKLKYLGYE